MWEKKSEAAANGREMMASPVALLALSIAQSQVGQEELPRGSNKGVMVNKYLQAVGLNPGYAWCQAFVYWCYAEAAKRLDTECPVIRTAGVYDCWNRTGKSSAHTLKLLRNELLQNSTAVLPGDQFIMTFGRAAGHTGLIESVEVTTGNSMLLHTIEGNSNASGSREGYAVVRRTRELAEKALQGFVRYR